MTTATETNVQLMSGNEACAEAALMAGIKFYGGYPITPSSEIAEILSIRMPMNGGVFIQMEDEIASICSIIGASLGGSKSMTATSGPGFSLMQENLGFASMVEVPCVIVNVMRAGPSTGLPTQTSQSDLMQARWGSHGDRPTIALCPWSVEETYKMTIESFNLAERYRVPVILLLDEIIGHMREKIVIPDPESIDIVERKKPDVPPEEYIPFDANAKDGVPQFASFGQGYRYHLTGLTHNSMGFPTAKHDEVITLMERLINKIRNNADKIIRQEEYMLEDADILVYAFGSSARTALNAIRTARAAGVKVGLLRPITIWPFPKKRLDKLSENMKAVIVAEQNMGQLCGEVERVVRGRCPVIRVNRYDGELFEPQEILDPIMKVAK
jgi:2-oxoglutarate/2-oxoacid ferredoxin oxidoreductase subunit alpha